MRALTILHLNINGFHPRRAEFLNDIEEARSHVICMSECKHELPLCFRGFNAIKPPHPNRPYNGGSAIFISKKLDAEGLSPHQPTNIELISVSLIICSSTLKIFHVYCPSSTLTQVDFDCIPTNHLDPTLLIGDLNANNPQLSSDRTYVSPIAKGI